MKPVDKLLIGCGSGMFVSGWVTRHPDLALGGLAILAGYVVVRVIAGEWPK